MLSAYFLPTAKCAIIFHKNLQSDEDRNLKYLTELALLVPFLLCRNHAPE